MAGMVTNGTIGVSGYDNRSVTLTVSGVCRQDVIKTSNYTVKVPHRRMPQAMQNIHRLGGKVVGVAVDSPVAASAGTTTIQASGGE